MRRAWAWAALPLTTAACASVLGIESVDYANVDTEAGVIEAGAPETGPLPDGAPGEACTGAVCGSRCCRKGALCTDGGGCSDDVVHVSGGGNGSCALLADGSAYCWGENGLGQVGVGDAGDDTCTFIAGALSIQLPCRTKPTKVQGLPAASTVSAGLQFACAVEAADGAVWCWGLNAMGSLGRLETDDPECQDLAGTRPDGGVPVVHCSATPHKIPGITGAVEVVASTTSACARTSTGSVFCWGNAASGQLGDDAGTSSPTPVKVQGLPSDIVQLSTALYAEAVCAVSADGHVWCWGGGIPLEPTTSTANMATGGGGSPLTDIAEVRVGVSSVCARKKSGVLVCWGENAIAQLGRGPCDTNGFLPVGTVIGVPLAKALDGRWLHSCALLQDRTVGCWGIAQDGALGHGKITGDGRCNNGFNSLGTPVVVPGLPPITKIATGIETTFAIDDSGRLWAWGANDFGRIGHPPNTSGDLTNCGDVGNQTVCHPSPILVQGLP